jgi:hypothetical protein
VILRTVVVLFGHRLRRFFKELKAAPLPGQLSGSLIGGPAGSSNLLAEKPLLLLEAFRRERR